MAQCRFCGKEITWLQEGRKKVPVENDGGKHECENFAKSRESIKTYESKDLDPDIIKQYQDAINNAKK